MGKIIEAPTRLSLSKLWTLQNAAYCKFGIQAWSKMGVPAYITSNSFTALNYARVVLGFLRDSLANGSLNFNFPIYILDLGAGTGRFAHLFLQELLPVLENLPSFKAAKICYVMTDIAEENIRFWRNHVYFKKYFEQGEMDCAIYHHAQTQPIHLICQNQDLDQKILVNPLILIANYFFDTIPQDLFYIRDGKLEEGRISLAIEENDLDIHIDDPLLINHLIFHYNYHPLSSKEYYQEHAYNWLLESYLRKFNHCPFLFPIGSLQALTNFMKWSDSRLMLIAGDQGVCTEQQIQEWGEPVISLHGSFSIGVSYHAISEFFQHFGGKGFFTSFSDPTFVVMAGALTKDKQSNFEETFLAFKTHIDGFEPVDYWKQINILDKQNSPLSLEQILLALKMGNWDPMCLHAFNFSLRKALSTASKNQKLQLLSAIDLSWERFFPIVEEEGSFIQNLGVLLFEMQYYAPALKYFQRAMEIMGPKEDLLRNMALCQKKSS